jgi:hypothetical protein
MGDAKLRAQARTVVKEALAERESTLTELYVAAAKAVDDAAVYAAADRRAARIIEQAAERAAKERDRARETMALLSDQWRGASQAALHAGWTKAELEARDLLPPRPPRRNRASTAEVGDTAESQAGVPSAANPEVDGGDLDMTHVATGSGQTAEPSSSPHSGHAKPL